MIGDVGFSRIMLWWGDYNGYESNIRYSIAEESFRQNLKIENIHAPFKIANSLWESPAHDIKDNLAYNVYKQCIDDCSRFSIPTLVIHPTRTSLLPEINSIVLNRIDLLAEYADKKNVQLAFENLKNLEYLDYIFENTYSTNIKFCYDSGHALCYNKDKNLLQKYSQRIITTHIHDNDGLSDLHYLMHDGIIKWTTLKKQLDDTGYTGSINFECNMKNYNNLNPYMFLETIFERASAIWK